jgi:hypothetical protein
MTIAASRETGEIVALRSMIAALPAPRQIADAFSLEAFIAEFRSADRGYFESQMPILTKLTRKAEVAKRLFTAYSTDLLKPVSMEIVSPDYVLALCGIFLAAAEHCGDYRLLNCALKMLDGIVEEPRIERSTVLDAWAEQLAR